MVQPWFISAEKLPFVVACHEKLSIALQFGSVVFESKCAKRTQISILKTHRANSHAHTVDKKHEVGAKHADKRTLLHLISHTNLVR